MVTMKHPYAQMLLERRGYKPIGVIPGYDREMRSDGKIIRIFEALYVKTLGSDEGLLHPNPDNQTPNTRALFEFLFPPGPKIPIALQALRPNPSRKLTYRRVQLSANVRCQNEE